MLYKLSVINIVIKNNKGSIAIVFLIVVFKSLVLRLFNVKLNNMTIVAIKKTKNLMFVSGGLNRFSLIVNKLKISKKLRSINNCLTGIS